jgi:hypothetical protein
MNFLMPAEITGHENAYNAVRDSMEHDSIGSPIRSIADHWPRAVTMRMAVHRAGPSRRPDPPHRTLR